MGSISKGNVNLIFVCDCGHKLHMETDMASRPKSFTCSQCGNKMKRSEYDTDKK